MEHLHSIFVNTVGLFPDMTIVVSVLVLVAVAFFILVPVLYYHLNVHDGLRSYNNHRYQIFVFAHKRFRKVLEGKMSYERFRDDVKKIYDKDNFDRVRNNETRNNKARNDFEFLAEAVDDEELIHRYFSGQALPFDKFEELETEMNIRPERKEKLSTTPQKRNPHDRKSKLTKAERQTDGSFQKLILDSSKAENIKEWMTSTLNTIKEGQEYAALFLALKEYKGIHFASTVELYDCINNTFNPGISLQYSAITEQLKGYLNQYCSEDVDEKIKNLIERFSNELNAI